MAKSTAFSRKSKGEIVFERINEILLGLLALLILYPLLYVISASFSDPAAVIGGRMLLWPVGFQLESYREVFRNAELMLGYRNSLLIMAMGTVLNLVMTILCAYPLSRRDLYGGGLMMKLITFTMFFSGGMIPMYLLIRELGLTNNWLSLLLPGAVSTYNMIIMRTYFSSSIPFDLQEAATIDGCTNIGILLRIILPLSGPIVAVLGLYYRVAHWNAYFNAMLYISNRKLYPLQLFLREILIMSQANNLMDVGSDEMARQVMRGEVIKYSIIVVSSVPLLLLYPFVQRFFVKGVMIGSIKG